MGSSLYDFRSDECVHHATLPLMEDLRRGAHNEIKSNLTFFIGKRYGRKFPNELKDLLLEYALAAEKMAVKPALEEPQWVELDEELWELREPGEVVDGRVLLDKPIDEFKCETIKEEDRRYAHMRERKK